MAAPRKYNAQQIDRAVAMLRAGQPRPKVALTCHITTAAGRNVLVDTIARLMKARGDGVHMLSLKLRGMH